MSRMAANIATKCPVEVMPWMWRLIEDMASPRSMSGRIVSRTAVRRPLVSRLAGIPLPTGVGHGDDHATVADVEVVVEIAADFAATSRAAGDLQATRPQVLRREAGAAGSSLRARVRYGPVRAAGRLRGAWHSRVRSPRDGPGSEVEELQRTVGASVSPCSRRTGDRALRCGRAVVRRPGYHPVRASVGRLVELQLDLPAADHLLAEGQFAAEHAVVGKLGENRSSPARNTQPFDPET